MWWWLAWGVLAWAAPEDALDDLTRSFWERGQRLEAADDLRGAAMAYRMTHQRVPTWSQALVAEGRVRAAAGDIEGALAAFGRAPYDADVVEARGRLLLEGSPEEAAQAFERLRRLRPEWPGVDLLLADARSRFDPIAALEPLQRYLDHREADVDSEGGVDTTLRVFEGLQEAGRRAEATELAVQVARRFPEAAGIERVQQALVRQEVDDEARALAAAAGVPLSPVGVDRLQQARSLAFEGDAAAARRALEDLAADEPRAAVVWSTLGRVLEGEGAIDQAVAAAQRAESLDPLEADYSAQLGELYAAHFGGRLDVRAARAYGRAVQRRGSDPELWHRKAAMERRVGWTTEAEASYRRVVALDPDGPLAQAARRHLEGFARSVPGPVDAPVGHGGRPQHVPQVAWDALHRAWAWQRRAAVDGEGSLQRALEEVERARTAAPDWVRPLNLEAAVRLDQGDTGGALALYRRSLELEPDQGAVHRMVSELLWATDPGRAAASLERAAELGEPAALLRRAEARAASGQLWAARADLARYRGLTVAGAERASALDERLALQQVGLVGSGVAAAAGLVALPLWWRRRRRAGVGLEALLERSPESFPEVARVLAAVRHEVLKHHTTVLDEVADALEDGQVDPGRWAAERLFDADGAIPRFRGYVEELERIGDRAGVRLNLAHRDPVFRPLLQAVDALCSLQGGLRRGDAAVARQLQELSIALNLDAYRALGRYLQRLCLLDIDEALVRSAWDAARAEAAFRQVSASFSFERPDGRLWVRAYRGDVHDVLVNLLRNALEAGVEAGAAEVGVRIDLDEDWVTGLERVEIRVQDRSPRPLTTAQVRGRFVGRGLGLAVDLVTRAGGAVHVEDEPGWAKAVVVRLARVERPEQEVA